LTGGNLNDIDRLKFLPWDVKNLLAGSLEVDILFKTKKLAKLCNSEKNLKRKCGQERAKIVRKRLSALDAADNLGVFQGQPGLGRCHELGRDRKGQLSLDLDGPYRLIIEPADNPAPINSSGGLDWNKVTAVRVLEITDTHD
jgi:plasmid maintenance system killer protein